jgi:hypothetical protein
VNCFSRFQAVSEADSTSITHFRLLASEEARFAACFNYAGCRLYLSSSPKSLRRFQGIQSSISGQLARANRLK